MLRVDEERDTIFGREERLRLVSQAKQEGRVRFMGSAVDDDPNVIGQCLNLFDFDTVLMPVNPAEPQYKKVLSNMFFPLARGKGMGIIGMKVFIRGLVRDFPFISFRWSHFFALPSPIRLQRQ